MSKSALTVLREARELISDPKRWTQGDYARTATGRPIGTQSDNAVCWCSIGALMKVTDDDEYACRTYDQAKTILRRSINVAGLVSVTDYNDANDHATVLRMFDAAIASAEKEAEQ